jgi:glycosyltransferase involved in cell wall biosynthesis
MIEISDFQPHTIPVSVIIPTFNASSTIERALESVLLQISVPAQIIVVDDASEDNTVEVLEKFCAAHSLLNIKKICLPKNVGPASARNVGWDNATEEFIAFLDADDSWHPQKLAIQYSWMKKHPDIVLSGHRCEFGPNFQTLFNPSENTCQIPYLIQIFTLNSFILRNRLSTPTVMLRRDIHQRFLTGKRYSEDYLLWVEIIATHTVVGFINLPLTHLYKNRYGASGLSGDLWEMQKGELDTLFRLYNASILKLNKWSFLALLTLSWMKFIKRFLICTLMRKL